MRSRQAPLRAARRPCAAGLALAACLVVACGEATTSGDSAPGNGSSGAADTSASGMPSTSGLPSTSGESSTGEGSTGAVATGACDGPATDDYWLCLMALPMGDGGANIGQQFRSQAELDAAGAGDDVRYCFDGNTESDGSGAACEADPFAAKQNAAKVLIPAGRHSISGQPRPAIRADSGDILITWDSWNSPQWYLGRTCADGGSIGTQKTFQVSAPAEGNASRWIEVRQRYTGSDHLDEPIAGWDPVTSERDGTDIATVDARSYGQLGAASQGDSDLAGQVADFVIKKSTWTRYWVLVEMNQGDPWTCGRASGAYDLVSIWLADENQAPVRLYERAEMETTRVANVTEGMCSGDEVLDEPLADDIVALWFEYNSSQGNCPDGGLADRIGYFRNFAALHTPESEGVIVADAASLVVADTEILLRPRP